MQISDALMCEQDKYTAYNKHVHTIKNQLLTYSHLINDGIVVSASLIIHTPTSIHKLKLLVFDEIFNLNRNNIKYAHHEEITIVVVTNYHFVQT